MKMGNCGCHTDALLKKTLTHNQNKSEVGKKGFSLLTILCQFNKAIAVEIAAVI